MNPNIQHNKATDRAWDRLYNRIEQDGLLPAAAAKKQALSKTLIWSAVAAACIVIAVVGVWKMTTNPETTDSEIIMVSNSDNQSTLVTTLQDGSIAYLNGETTIKHPALFDKDKREIAMQGNAFFEISKNKEQPFFIDTEPVTIQVLGTAFNIDNKDKENFTLSVKHGEVKVTLKKNGQSIHVSAGETVSLESDKLIKTETPHANVFDGYIHQIHFKDERLDNIIKVINMNTSGTQLQLAPELADRTLTVAFADNEPADMARLICLALNLSYRQEGTTIIIGEP